MSIAEFWFGNEGAFIMLMLMFVQLHLIGSQGITG